MSGGLDRQAVMEILRNFDVGDRATIHSPQYREDIANELMRLIERRPVMHVQYADAEESARLQNLGWDAAVEQFAELLADVREDLNPAAPAIDMLKWLDDAVEATVSNTRAATVRRLEQVRDASITAAEQGAVDRCIAALTGGAR